MASSVKNDDRDQDLALVRSQFEEYADATTTSSALAQKCRDYRDGNQWTEEEKKALKRRKQPCITDNKIQDKCDTLLGIEKQMRTDPKAFPRNPVDDGAAEAATDALRYIADSSDYHRTVRKTAADNLMVEGLCAGQVIVEKKKNRPPKVCMEHIRFDRVYYDIHALREDFDDKTYCGYSRWMDYEIAKREFPKNAEKLDASVTTASMNEASEFSKTHNDNPYYVMTQGKRKRVQVFKHYLLRDGVWHEGVWCKGGWLEELEPCKYVDEYGEPMCCLEIQALYRDSDGNPYGSVPRYLDLQDEHNKRRSKMLHLLNAKRIVAQNGAVTDQEGGIAKLREEVHKPDGVVLVNGDISQFRVEDNLNEAQGQWQLLQQTDAALSQTGPNAALQGQTGSISGRAKQLDQSAGSLPISPLFEALDGWELRMYRQAWQRVKQYWTAEMWIRVTDDENKVKFVGLNQPVLAGDMLAEQLKSTDMAPGEKMAQLQEIAADPSMQQPHIENGKPKLKNEVAVMDVDIIIDRTSDTVNVQQEQFQMLAQLAETRPEIPFDVLVEMSQLRSEIKKRVTDRIKGTDDPAAQARAQMMQQMEQLQAALAEANVRKVNSEAAKNEAATAETQVDASVKVATFTSHDPAQPAMPGAAPGASGPPPAAKTQVSVN
jgi:hypothetical protein